MPQTNSEEDPKADLWIRTASSRTGLAGEEEDEEEQEEQWRRLVWSVSRTATSCQLVASHLSASGFLSGCFTAEGLAEIHSRSNCSVLTVSTAVCSRANCYFCGFSVI